MGSFATNLVTSLEVNPIRCDTTLCDFRRTRNRYLATHFFLPSAESSATNGYVVVQEGFGQNEEPANKDEERSKKKPSFVPSSGFNQCKM